MTRKITRVIGLFMLFVTVKFVIVACNNPQMSFPWSNTITYMLYIVWLAIMILCIVAPFEKMNEMNSSISAIIPLTLLQYIYWNWLVKELMSNTLRNRWFLIVSVMITLFYCVYEKLFVYTVVSADTSFRDRMPPAVFWIVESMIFAIVSNRIVYHYEEKYERAFVIGFRSVECLFVGVILIVSFLVCRKFLYRKKENQD